ncbi:MAG TPA: cation transporter [Nocardioides sp.]|jgi:copper ion binding protein|nr:cation transporter [uncultured Nocardioides sp.]HEX5986357.1 cation transporter [Nocardioides sp.]
MSISTAASTSATSRFQVTGMTCGHCVMAVTRELSALPGVSEVEVTLATGDVTVTHDQPLDTDQVTAAIDEAGYALAR